MSIGRVRRKRHRWLTKALRRRAKKHTCYPFVDDPWCPYLCCREKAVKLRQEQIADVTEKEFRKDVSASSTILDS